MCLAIPGKIESISGQDDLERVGRVNFGGVTKEVSLACVPAARLGDYVIVHVGVALSVVDQEEAEAVLQYVRRIDELGAGAAGSESIPGRASADPA